MQIKVFGPGCARCKQTEQVVREAVAAVSHDLEVIKVDDLKEIMLSGVISMPAVLLDGEVKASGRVPEKGEVEAWIKEALGRQSSAANSSASSSGCSSGAATEPAESAAPTTSSYARKPRGGCGCGGRC